MTDNEKEVFKYIKDYEELYQVSTLGNVKSLKHGKERMLKPSGNGNGYLKVNLSKNGKMKQRRLHSLVAESFLGHKTCGYKLVVNHINFNKQDNRVENLEIVTQRENSNKKHIKSSSKYTGVCWNKQAKKWHSQIRINGKIKHLGYFTEEDLAANAYINALENIKKNE